MSEEREGGLCVREVICYEKLGGLSQGEQIAVIKEFLQGEEAAIEVYHGGQTSGVVVCRARAELFDATLCAVLELQRASSPGKWPEFALVAVGGYGRGILNPKSDLDLLFLLPRASNQIPKNLEEAVQKILYLLWDVGLKVSQVCRSIGECVEQAQADQENKTALMDARFLAGSEGLFAKFHESFRKNCIDKGQEQFLELRRLDLRSRHAKSSHTVFLQEPNVKESCGGLRDYHNICWVTRVKLGVADPKILLERRMLSVNAYREIEEAHDFLLRVRNDLHYITKKASDLLTLRFQGIVASNFRYPQVSILRRTEAFMRDYYRHTRNLYQHMTSLMEMFEIEQEEVAMRGLRSFLMFRKKAREEFDGFVARGERIYPANGDIFEDDPNRLMRMFQHCQVRGLRLSPPMRKLVKASWLLVDKTFRYAKANRETFQAILERKGDVARTLRQMHRVGFLGRYLPEFGALDCLVQHEFFHRYTADEHTLRCVEQLDGLFTDVSPGTERYRKLLVEVEDPYALYLSMILHDTGRAENVREHIDGSAMLASRLCNRLQIHGERRSWIMFLVDNHLTFWRTATTKNIEDPEVIEEFAAVMKTRAKLDALFLFTYADSNATSPESWNSWKETLMIQLHSATRRFLQEGREQYAESLQEDREKLRESVLELMREDYHPYVNEHFERTPDGAFRFRKAGQIVTQVRTVRHFLQAEEGDEYAVCMKWVDQPEKGYTEMFMATRDRPQLLEKLCCALAAEQVNILSADFFTRTDGIVFDVFRVCTTNFEPVTSVAVRQRVLKIFREIFCEREYQAEMYLKRRMNFLRARTDVEIVVPLTASVSNDLHPSYTSVEIQALDRIGLLHDLFATVNGCGLTTKIARICTEKGVAMDTLYVVDTEGKKVEDLGVLRGLELELGKVIAKGEVTG